MAGLFLEGIGVPRTVHQEALNANAVREEAHMIQVLVIARAGFGLSIVSEVIGRQIYKVSRVRKSTRNESSGTSNRLKVRSASKASVSRGIPATRCATKTIAIKVNHSCVLGGRFLYHVSALMLRGYSHTEEESADLFGR